MWARALLLCILLTGCGSQSQEASDDRGKALRVLLPRDAEHIDPRVTVDAYGLRISRLLFASLVTIDPQTLEPVPDLAESVQVVSPVEYRVTLRAGLHFSDGSVLDSEDVRMTYTGLREPSLRSPYARTYARIIDIKTPTPREIVFRINGPHATFLTDLEMPIVRAEDSTTLIGAGSPVVSSGAFRLIARSAGRIELVANPRWHGGTPKFSDVHFLVVRDDNTRALRLLAGAADLAMGAVPPLLIPLFEGRAEFSVTQAPGIGTAYLGARTDRGPLADVRVRKALSLLIDREAIIANKFGGRARVARGWITPGHWAFANEVPEPRFDMAEAEALLDAAGFPVRDGERMRLVLRCGSDRFRQSLAQAIAAMARRAHITIEVRPSEVATLLADLNRGNFDLGLLEVPEVIEPHVLSWFFGSDRIPDGERAEGANRWRFRNKEVDAALERGRRVVDRGERITAYVTAQRILASELPVIPLWHEDVVAVVGPRASGFVVPRDARFSTLAR